jgi:pyruvate/2-oxoglutarate dehydrogenase complex dihydrolipoamide acyltransferase (E2) component
VDLAKVKGSGPSGRVLKEDVEAFKSGLDISIADRLVDRIAEKSGATSTAEMYAAASEPMPESAASEVQPAAQQAAAAAAAAAVPGGAGAAVQGPTRIPIRGYRRWEGVHWCGWHGLL